MMLALREPVRIITKNTILSVSTAAMLLGIFSENNIRCAVRIIPNYMHNELETFLHEEYNSYIILDCNESIYHTRMESRVAFFLDAAAAYEEIDMEKKQFAHLGIIGIAATALEHNLPVKVSDSLLQDALNAQVMKAEIKPMLEIDNTFFEAITIPFDGTMMKIMEIAKMTSAASRMGKATTAISALLGDERAQNKVVQYFGEYQREMEAALEWCKQHEKEIHKNMGVVIVHLKDYVASYLTGSIAAHFVKQMPKALVMVMAYAQDKRARVSLRSAGQDSSMQQLLSKIFEGIEGEHGGDAYAAGGIFSRSDEEKFFSAARKVLEKEFVEEKV